VDFLAWLQQLGTDADPGAKGFQARPLYLVVAVLLPVGVGLFVGFGLRLIERVFGVTRAKGGH
jgi:hypothetical protein